MPHFLQQKTTIHQQTTAILLTYKLFFYFHYCPAALAYILCFFGLYPGQTWQYVLENCLRNLLWTIKKFYIVLVVVVGEKMKRRTFRPRIFQIRLFLRSDEMEEFPISFASLHHFIPLHLTHSHIYIYIYI